MISSFGEKLLVFHLYYTKNAMLSENLLFQVIKQLLRTRAAFAWKSLKPNSNVANCSAVSNELQVRFCYRLPLKAHCEVFLERSKSCCTVTS